MKREHKLSPDDQNTLQKLYNNLLEKDKNSIGFPVSRVFDYSELFKFLYLAINNVGDPFENSLYKVNTHTLEREVIREFEKLFNADQDKCWGYVTHGGSESNTFGIYVGHEVMGKDSVLYYSKDSHYSIQKASRLEHFLHEEVEADEKGEMDYEDFKKKLSLHKDCPAVIVANVGTTVTGACDNIAKIKSVLAQVNIPKHYIHCDAAFHGMIYPFCEDAPKFDFKEGIDSLCFSGHKIIGSPIPCSVVITYKKHKECIQTNVEYVGLVDSTLAGSRCGISPLILWYALKTVGMKGIKKVVTDSIELADYAIEKLSEGGVYAWRNKASMIVIIPKPSAHTMDKWQLSPRGDIAHLITLEHTSKEMIDQVVADILKDKAV